MDKSLTQKIQDEFDRLALHDQDEWNHNNHYHPFLIKQLPSKCHTVLDLGCGVGKFSRLLAKYADEVVAIDLSPKSIQVAKQKSADFTNINFQVADISQWQFPPAHFDAIASIATLHHLALEELLPQFQDSLKPGGVLIILDLLKHHNIQDTSIDLIAVPLNWWFLAAKNKHIKTSPEAAQAMREHLRTDEYLNFLQVKKIYTDFLKTPKIRRHLFWRYSVVWHKPQL